MSQDINYKTITQLNKLLTNKEISVTELSKEKLNHIKKNSHNAILSNCESLALQQSSKAQIILDSGESNLLTGIPTIYKDNFNIEGQKTTCASKILENYRSVYNAQVVNSMQNQGSISIAKANMDEFAMGSTNENSAFGAVLNPFNSKYCSGGSSGGSAAAVASGLSPVAFGTDTGGSVRQPASFCGIVGLKPTYGRVSRFGIVAFGSSFDQAGIFTRDAYDSAAVLSTIAHYDDKDSTSVNIASENYLDNINNDLKGKKIGLVKDLFDRVQDSEAQKCFENSINEYKKLGVEFVDIELPNPEICVSAYYILSSSECSTNLSRYDGVRYGHRSEKTEDLDALYLNSRTEGFGDEVKNRILLGTFALSAGYFDAYYVKAQKMRRYILNHFLELYKNIDAIMLPTSLITAPQIGKEFNYNDDMCTITANLAGLPAASFPIGFASGLPVGMQIIGKHFGEKCILNTIHKYQQVTNFHNITPSNI